MLSLWPGKNKRLDLCHDKIKIASIKAGGKCWSQGYVCSWFQAAQSFIFQLIQFFFFYVLYSGGFLGAAQLKSRGSQHPWSQLTVSCWPERVPGLKSQAPGQDDTKPSKNVVLPNPILQNSAGLGIQSTTYCFRSILRWTLTFCF